MSSYLQMFWLVALAAAGAGCSSTDVFPSKAQRACEERVTERFASTYIRRFSTPVAALAHRGADLPQGLLNSNRVTLVEVRPKKGDDRILFQDESKRPPYRGFTTMTKHARNIGLFYPANLDQGEIEVRVNYYCDMGDFVAVHLVVPNPMLLQNTE